MTNRIAEIFRNIFGDEPLVARAPGRINILGEHTDYNEGFVLPAAIDKHVYVAVSGRSDSRVHLYSADFSEQLEYTLQDIQPVKSWATYILGVARGMMSRGYRLEGFNIVVAGEIPQGAGLSSSAALECAVVVALDRLFALNMGRMEMVMIAREAEEMFAGVRCGVMDQFASMFGKKDHVIKLDCRSLVYEYLPLQMCEHTIVLFNTNVKHSLASSAYNQRRQQCEQGVTWVQEEVSDIRSLRDVTLTMLEAYVAPRDTTIYRRCRYVIEEIERLSYACRDLLEGNIGALGKKMFATHEGLSEGYEVSCKELDFLVGAAKRYPVISGARMMGGGFGGCTINLVTGDFMDEISLSMTRQYSNAGLGELSTYIVKTADGAEIVRDKTETYV
jgi:galactokinase